MELVMTPSSLLEKLNGKPIDVLLGGFSNEREVSLASGGAVADALEGAGYPVRRLDVSAEFERVGREQLVGTGLVFIMLHGEFGEDGGVQQLLDQWGLPYTGSDPVASRVAMDKLQTKDIFGRRGIATARWRVVDEGAEAAQLVEEFGLPLVVKPSESGSSLGVSIVEELASLGPALAEAARQRGSVMVEEFVAGREVTVGVLGSEALPLIELVPRGEFYDYDAKYSDDAGTEYLCPAPLEESVAEALQAEALAAHRALGCRDFSRVDLRLTSEGQGSVLEVNTIPGFTSHSLLPKAAAAVGISFTQLVERIAELALARE
jgi:D-alanine-D-alanine ligase